MICTIRYVFQCLSHLQGKTTDYDNSGAMTWVKLYSPEMFTLSFAFLGNLFFQNQPAIRSLYISNFTTFEFSSKKIYQMIIFKEIFENIIYTNIFTVLKKHKLLLMTVLPTEHLPGMYPTYKKPPLYLLVN